MLPFSWWNPRTNRGTVRLPLCDRPRCSPTSAPTDDYSYYYFRFISWRWELGKVLTFCNHWDCGFRDGDRNATDFVYHSLLISSASRCQLGLHKSLWSACHVRQTLAHNRFKKKREISRRITPKDKELKPTPASSTGLKQAFGTGGSPLSTDLLSWG